MISRIGTWKTKRLALTGQNLLSGLRPKRPPIWVHGAPLVPEIRHGGLPCMPDCLRKNNAARVQRGEHGWPPPNQPHQIVPTGWGDGWMGMGATPGAEFNTRCQLIRSVPYLIQGVDSARAHGAQPASAAIYSSYPRTAGVQTVPAKRGV